MVGERRHLKPQWQARLAALQAGLITLGVCLACTLMAYYGGRTIYFESASREMLAIANSGAAMVDLELHRSLRKPGMERTEAYERAVAPLRSVGSKNRQVRYIYTCVLVNGQVHFVLDPTPVGDHDEDGIDDKSYLMQPYGYATADMMKAFTTRKSVVELTPATDQWGTFVSAYVPLFHSNGDFEGILGIDIDYALFAQRYHHLDWLMGIGLVISSSFALIVYCFVSRRTYRHLVAQNELVEAKASLEAMNEVLEASTHDLERRVEARTAELEAALAVKNQFLANMSHEMRTPLNGIIGMNMLLLETHLSDEQREYAELTHQSSLHLLQIISDILDIVRMRAGKQTLEIEPTNVNLAVKDACNALSISASRGGLRLDVELDEDIPLGIDGNALRIRQIVTNLVGNAIKFTNPPGWIKVATGFDGDYWTLTVSDTGIGIPKESLASIFEEFTQVDSGPTRRGGGTGLGLSITHSLVELMGGDVSVESEVGVGTVFRVRIPILKAGMQMAA